MEFRKYEKKPKYLYYFAYAICYHFQNSRIKQFCAFRRNLFGTNKNAPHYLPWFHMFFKALWRPLAPIFAMLL